MKAKQFLKIIKHLCTEENCHIKTCPFYGLGLCITTDSPKDWNIPNILKAAKKARKNLC